MERNEITKIGHIDFNLLEKILEFLYLFKECSERLSMEKIPTISEYVLWYEKLIKHCNTQCYDSEIMVELKSCTKKALKKRFEPQIIHYIALFLNPPIKELKFCTEEQKTNVACAIKNILQDAINNLKFEVPVPDCRPTTSKSNPFYEYMDITQPGIQRNMTLKMNSGLMLK